MNTREWQQWGQVAKKINDKLKLHRFWNLTGGISAQVTALELLEENGTMERVVARLHGEADRLRNPHIARHEFQLLRMLHEHGLPVPAPVLLDETGHLFPQPYLVTAFSEGRVELSPSDSLNFAKRMAAGLAAVHRIPYPNEEINFLPSKGTEIANKLAGPPEKIDESLNEDLIRQALGTSDWLLLSPNSVGLLHGDYWPGNLLWENGELSAILDWEDAAVGDPVSDVGNARLEVLWAYGEEAMDAFTQEYARQMPSVSLDQLPYWDLCAALRPASQLSNWGLAPEIEARMRGLHRRFVERALG
ncbi:phosphotransferase family protein [Paenibacillus sp. GCM10027627]|uniref:phosphotransferase family protein n=1 Tax=unclassified Paenibacillus TaxID=185978 RepID=UPI00362F14D8